MEYKKKKTSILVSNSFSALEEANEKPIDDLTDDTRKKMEAPPRRLPERLVVSYLHIGDLYKLLLVSVMVTPAVSVYANSLEESFRDTIMIEEDITHPVLITSAIFPTVTAVIRLAQHREAIRGERKIRKGQNRIKTRQKQEAWSSSKLSRDQAFNPNSSTNPTPKGRIHRSSKQNVENLNFKENPLPTEVPMAENQTMAQLLQAPTDGYEDAIVIPDITATNFELKHSLINLVQNKHFFGHEKEDPHAHLHYFNKITSTMRDRFNDLLRACPHHGFSELHQLDTFYNALNVNDQDSLNSAAGGNFLDKMPADCLKIIESKSKVRKTRAKAVVAKVNSSSSTPAVSSDVSELKDMVRALLLDKKNQYLALTPSPTPAPIKAVEPNYVTSGGTHAYQNCPATSENVYQDNIQEYVSQAAAANYVQGNTGFRPQMVANQIRPPGFPPVNQPLAYQASAYQASVPQTQRLGTLPGNTITNLKEDLKGITTRSGVTYQEPTIPTPSEVAKQGTEVTKDQVQTSNSQTTAPVQPTVIQSESETPVFEPVVAPVSVPMPNLKPSIPYPSRRDNERRRDQANAQIEKFYKIFKDMSFEISFTDALMLMPKFASTLKALIGNKEKLSEMARTPMNEHCSAVILNKLPKKLGDPSPVWMHPHLNFLHHQRILP
nr:reverse transcriptase domain-containing protein [Tanacetum cinerariifolium]